MARGGAVGRWAAACAAAIIACLAAAAPAGAANENFFGVNAQAVFDLPSSSWDMHLAKMSSGGLQLVRRDASWAAAEPNPPDSSGHHYDWTRFDEQVSAYARHGLRWTPTIDYSNQWSGQVRGDPFTPPARTSDFTSYAAALAQRYGRGGSFWRTHPALPQLPVTRYEVWNEENTEHFWHPQSDAPERYADLYLATRGAIRAVDPAARVTVGGLALANTGVTSETEFVDRMYAHRPDLAGRVDAFGFHPYTPDVDGMYAKLRQFRATLARHGAGSVPLEITEIGWTTTGTSEADRAAMLSRIAQELPRSDCRVESLVPHTWLTYERDRSNPEDWFGIVNADGTPKPSGSAYLGAVSKMRGAGAPRGTVHICGDAGATSGRAGAGKKGPRVKLRLRRSRHHHRRLAAYVRCPSGCRVKLELLPRAGASRVRRPLARRSLRFSKRRRRVVMKARGKRRKLELRVTATGRSGAVTVRVRKVRLQPARRR